MIIKRKGALGDCLMITPAIKEYRELHPEERIIIETDYPQVFEELNVTCVSKINSDYHIDLNGAYEADLNKHPTMVACEKILGNIPKSDLKITLKPNDVDYSLADSWIEHTLNKDKKTIIFHINSTWIYISPYELDSLILALHSQYNLVFIGKDDQEPNGICCRYIHNLINSGYSIRTLLALIDRADCFVGGDSGISHVSFASETPSIVMYGFINPHYRMPLWNKKFYPVTKKCLYDNQFCAEENKCVIDNEFRGLRDGTCNEKYCTKFTKADLLPVIGEVLNG